MNVTLLTASAIAAQLFAVAAAAAQAAAAGDLPEGLQFFPGHVNRALVAAAGDAGSAVAVYGRVPPAAAGGAKAGTVLLTHARRDVLPGTLPVERGGREAEPKPDVEVVAPGGELESLRSPVRFWRRFSQARFHDYAQQSSKVPFARVVVGRWVKGGETFEAGGRSFRVLDTPGYTRGSVTYLCEVGGASVAFTGDLIYGDGQLLDLYSLQDAIPDAQVGGYHGYAGRLGSLVASLEALQREAPDLLVPARGPLVRDPAAAIDKLLGRVRAIYKNYLSTNALHWYFKEDRMRTCGERVLGSRGAVELMPYAAHVEAPDWVLNHGTSRLIVSDDGYGFLLDCGSDRILQSVQEHLEKGTIKAVEGIFVTHFHDDHSDRVQAAAEAFGCPVYATAEYADVLENPGAYKLPAMTANAIADVQVKGEGERMDWRGFAFTFHFFPGQTYYHGALWVEKKGDGGPPIFFIGDSFAPSGIDDYCLLNRNLLHEDAGYLYCLRKIRHQVEGGAWLINEHIAPRFRFSPGDLDYLETRYRERKKLLAELFPWDDPNYGIDEQWAVFYPYGATVRAGRVQEFAVRLTNHSPAPRSFTITPHGWGGAEAVSGPATVELPARGAGQVTVRVRAPSEPGTYLVTADVASGEMQFRHWAEAILTVE